MGPSGAGKTTLLKLLALEPMSGGVAYGNVTLNGRPLTPTLYTGQCASVEQVDTLWAFLSCREQLAYAVDLCEPMLDVTERWVAVNRLLQMLGLEACQHTKAGNALMKGLSGGQKRRLSLGVALAKKPALVFLDEPTSGLDAASAAKVMKLLGQVALAQRMAVMCTIHQPSTSVFAGFDQTLVLSGGRVAYFGAASGMAEFLATAGRPVPPLSSVADTMLDAVNTDFTSTEAAEEVLAAWERRAAAQSAPPIWEELSKASESKAAATTSTPWLRQVGVLLRKQLRLLTRDPLMYLMRLMTFATVSCFFSALYIDSRTRTQQQVPPAPLPLPRATTCCPA
eukprot:7380730-Prymnesium_polylepis.1